MEVDKDEYNRQAHLRNFPPEQGWKDITGVISQQSIENDTVKVSIQGHDASGSPISFWVDLPNAMFLLNMLANVQRDLQAPVPNTQPKPYNG